VVFLSWIDISQCRCSFTELGKQLIVFFIVFLYCFQSYIILHRVVLQVVSDILQDICSLKNIISISFQWNLKNFKNFNLVLMKIINKIISNIMPKFIFLLTYLHFVIKIFLLKICKNIIILYFFN
jgi:hypothetical protein